MCLNKHSRYFLFFIILPLRAIRDCVLHPLDLWLCLCPVKWPPRSNTLSYVEIDPGPRLPRREVADGKTPAHSSTHTHIRTKCYLFSAERFGKLALHSPQVKSELCLISVSGSNVVKPSNNILATSFVAFAGRLPSRLTSPARTFPVYLPSCQRVIAGRCRKQSTGLSRRKLGSPPFEYISLRWLNGHELAGNGFV